MIVNEIKQALFNLQDTEYREFQKKLIPNIEGESVIGVRTTALRSYAKELSKRDDIELFLADLPHKYYDENQLHAFIISEIKPFDKCLREVERFLPYVDNWATCDQLSPKVFKKHRAELVENINIWLESGFTYTVRFAVGMLMQHFLDEDFNIKYPARVSKIISSEYYINMMVAWYFATALAKQYEAVVPFIENCALERWTHNKAIQKAVESYRISPERKEYLKSLRIKSK